MNIHPLQNRYNLSDSFPRYQRGYNKIYFRLSLAWRKKQREGGEGGYMGGAKKRRVWPR